MTIESARETSTTGLPPSSGGSPGRAGRATTARATPHTKAPKARAIAVRSGAADLYPVPEEVDRVVRILGSNAVADVLGVARSQPSRWRSGRERISPPNRRRLADLDHVLHRLLLVLWPEQASGWLTADNPHLGGRPIDVLALRGAGPVIDAIDALDQGAYA
ncbi:MAG: DUF2384 domain-containing protein [Acidimicrobiales bacterium]|nr:DUF2384 domain-containing protein [Acidimicrobiales bacterium]